VKKIYLVVVLTLLLGLLIGCQTTPQMYRSKNAPAGFALDAEGMLVHTHSGGKFPMKLSSFTRGAPRIYDEQGYDVSLSYILEGRWKAQADVYIYPTAGRSMEDHFEGVKGAIEKHNPGARQIDEREGGEHAEDRSHFRSPSVSRELCIASPPDGRRPQEGVSRSRL
jgi:hypothetical protein